MMKTEEIFKKIYQDLKEEVLKNDKKIFIKEYEIPSMTFSKNENKEDLWWASGIEMELYQMMRYFDYKVYFSSYKDKYFFSNSPKKADEKMLLLLEKENKEKNGESR